MFKLIGFEIVQSLSFFIFWLLQILAFWRVYFVNKFFEQSFE